MKVVTAIDSFKGSMTSMEAGFAAAEGIHRVDADAEVQVRPLADGGEGTVEALVAGMNGKTEHVKVTGPLVWQSVFWDVGWRWRICSRSAASDF